MISNRHAAADTVFAAWNLSVLRSLVTFCKPDRRFEVSRAAVTNPALRRRHQRRPRDRLVHRRAHTIARGIDVSATCNLRATAIGFAEISILAADNVAHSRRTGPAGKPRRGP